ncbi:hypothetical protein [Bradyrhizobium sp. USDA 4454]
MGVNQTLCLLLWIGALADPASAQSIDPHRPTVLGLGVNRANITNDVRGHYYTFMAGPGHVDVELAWCGRDRTTVSYVLSRTQDDSMRQCTATCFTLLSDVAYVQSPVAPVRACLPSRA